MNHTDTAPPRATIDEPPGALAPYRVLDLTTELGALSTRLLAGMGADVIRIEPPGGHATRRRGPFLDGVVALERSLYWLQMNAGKRGVTLNLETADGRALLRRLAERADFVVESLPVGALDRLGLGFEQLRAVNPCIIVTSISPFGADGPRSGDPATDLTGMAAGGLLFLCGDRDRPPVRVTVEQAYAQAGIQAAVATMIAHFAREATGQGTHVDVSMQECVLTTLGNNRLLWPADRVVTHRAGGGRAFGDAGNRLIYEAADGYAGFMRRSEQHLLLQRWLDDEGIDLGFSVADWQGLPLYGEGAPPAEQVAALEAVLAAFFAGRRKRDLQRDAQGRGLILAEVASPLDLASDEHLAARGYFVPVEYPEFGRALRVPGAPFIASVAPWRTGRAPRRGEHNVEIYCDEMGLSRDALSALKAAGAI
ncbi:MAG: CaiB/BaiF CoA transferase family protein [Dehalococcoidia bacterium]